MLRMSATIVRVSVDPLEITAIPELQRDSPTNMGSAMNPFVLDILARVHVVKRMPSMIVAIAISKTMIIMKKRSGMGDASLFGWCRRRAFG